ncbi:MULTISPECIES: hypothetical protein [unclassified Pseudomonas]|jgi:hypothetical protein|uniref:hypothetical protein n=1 Tax=Pseudomonas TaxID=286 RepID=UPI000BCA1A5F|nr:MULTISPECIES: hypothetical protein [unclassified Pseudomonas]OYT76886.1 MAG: hypothetical protein CFE48_23405 [Pseudomonas sp. PGPPP2]PIB54120.1 hypothetical protein AOA61_20645 [Pseudomonas sp. 2995-1]
MKIRIWLKSFALLMLVGLVLSTTLHLALYLPFIVKYVGVGSSLGQKMLIFTAMDILAYLVWVLPAGLLLIFNLRKSAYGVMLIVILISLKFPEALALAQLLMWLWAVCLVLRTVLLAVWLSGCKLRDLYNYHRSK